MIGRAKAFINYTARKMHQDAVNDELSKAFRDYVKTLTWQTLADRVYDCLLPKTIELLASTDWTVARLRAMKLNRLDLRANLVYTLLSSIDAYGGSTRNFARRIECHMVNCQNAIDGKEYDKKVYYDRVKKNGVMPDAVILGINRFNQEPLFLEVMEDLLIRALRLFGPERQMQRQRNMADRSFHPHTPQPEWRGANAILPCCAASQAHSVTFYNCGNSDCDESFDDIWHWGMHMKRDHGEPRPFRCDTKDCTSAFETIDSLRTHLYFQNHVYEWYCDVCDFSTTSESKTAHLKSAKHIQSVNTKAKNQDPGYCEACKVTVDLKNPRSWARHLESDAHKKATGKEYTKYCEPCKKDVSISHWKEHTKTKGHMKAAGEEIPTKHCEACDVTVEVSGWRGHIKSQSHLKAVGEEVPMKHCDDCDVDVLASTWQGHVRTQGHLKAAGKEEKRHCDACGVSVVKWAKHVKTKKHQAVAKQAADN
jgi:hypothetical protein